MPKDVNRPHDPITNWRGSTDGWAALISVPAAHTTTTAAPITTKRLGENDPNCHNGRVSRGTPKS